MFKGVIYMNKKGFTLVELIATIAVLGIIVSISIYAANGGFAKAKEKSEDVFIKTLQDALDIYTDSNAKSLSFSSASICTIEKRFGSSNVYKNTATITFRDIINSDYTPLTAKEVVNPANETVPCDLGAPVSIYRDDDFVYYYQVSSASLKCLNTEGDITNLPSGCM